MTPRSRRRRARVRRPSEPPARPWASRPWLWMRPLWSPPVWAWARSAWPWPAPGRPWASRRRRRPRSRAAGRAEGSASSFLLSALALIEVGDPLGDLGVLGCEAAVRLVMLQRAVAIAEVEVAEDGEIPMRVMKVGKRREGRFVAGARLRELSLATLHQPELVPRNGLLRT